MSEGGVEEAEAEPTDMPERLGIRDRYLRRTRTTHLVWRIVVGVIGTAIIGLGIVLLPLPGPGWLIIFAGLAVLASEFEWAQRLLEFARDKVLMWTRWVNKRPLWIRFLIGAAFLILATISVLGVMSFTGVPDWLPDGLQDWLESWVPQIG